MMHTDSIVRIAPKVQACISLFGELCRLPNLAPDSDAQSRIVDQLGRFRLWAGNIGAFQELPLPSSLDNRLREAPKVASQIKELLDDLTEALQDVLGILSGDQPNRFGSATDDERRYVVSDDDGLDTASHSSDQSQAKSELEELLESLGDTVTSLFRISVLIRGATKRDRYAKSTAAGGEPFDAHFDITHVGHKFPRAHQIEWLEKRLGNAITQRRQYLRYCRQHREKIGMENNSTKGNEDVDTSQSRVKRLGEHGELSSRVEDSLTQSRAPSTLAITTASTLNVAAMEKSEEVSDDAQSQTSYATSMGSDQKSDDLRVPPLSEDASRGLPFECPYCCTILTIKSRRAWKRHVFSDLKPYVCTFGDCDLKMFSERSAWFNHELQAHRVELSCPFCSHSPFQSSQSFDSHLQGRHAQILTPEQSAAIASSCQRSVNKIPPQACPLCDEWSIKLKDANPELPEETLVVTISQFEHHVGAHMEQLALFALPRDLGDRDASTGAAGGPDNHSMLDLASQASSEDTNDPPLHVTAYEGLESKVRQLLSDGAEINAHGETWGNALTAAVMGGHPLIVQVLLDHGAATDLAGGPYGSPLQAAERKGDDQIYQLILDAQSDEIGATATSHLTLLAQASARGDIKEVQEQLSHNASSKYIQDDFGKSPLHHAAINGHTEVARLLLAAECYVNCQDNALMRPLHWAALNGFEDLVRVLLEAPGRELDCRDRYGDTPLHWAVRHGHTLVIRQLIFAGAHLECPNNRLGRPIHYALKSGHLETVRLLIDAGCEFQWQDVDGNTPLHLAVRRGQAEGVDLILALNPDPTIRNKKGQQPINLRSKYLGIAEAQASMDKLKQYHDQWLKENPEQPILETSDTGDQPSERPRSTKWLMGDPIASSPADTDTFGNIKVYIRDLRILALSICTAIKQLTSNTDRTEDPARSLSHLRGTLMSVVRQLDSLEPDKRDQGLYQSLIPILNEFHRKCNDLESIVKALNDHAETDFPELINVWEDQGYEVKVGKSQSAIEDHSLIFEKLLDYQSRRNQPGADENFFLALAGFQQRINRQHSLGKDKEQSGAQVQNILQISNSSALQHSDSDKVSAIIQKLDKLDNITGSIFVVIEEIRYTDSGPKDLPEAIGRLHKTLLLLSSHLRKTSEQMERTRDDWLCDELELVLPCCQHELEKLKGLIEDISLSSKDSSSDSDAKRSGGSGENPSWIKRGNVSEAERMNSVFARFIDLLEVFDRARRTYLTKAVEAAYHTDDILYSIDQFIRSTETKSLRAQTSGSLPAETKWMYLDLKRHVQGPFSSAQMYQWFQAGFFHSTLKVRRLDDTMWESLSTLFDSTEDSEVTIFDHTYTASRSPDVERDSPLAALLPPPGLGEFPVLGPKRQTFLRENLLAEQEISTVGQESSSEDPNGQPETFQGVMDRWLASDSSVVDVGLLQREQCDTCGRSLTHEFFWCSICKGGNFCVCNECKSQGKHCENASHALNENWKASGANAST